MKVKALCLCAACYSEATAARCLRAYIARYTCRFPFNRQLFDMLVARIDWSEVTEQYHRRLRLFGKFLQRQEITPPLSWEKIERLMPPLTHARRYTAKAIRICLWALGHLIAERGDIEPYDEYAARRAARTPIALAPKEIEHTLILFADWLDARQMKPSTVGHHLRALA